MTGPKDFKEVHWLHQLYMQAPVAIGIYIGKDFVVQFANPSMCKIWGRSEEHVLNKPLFEALPEVADQGYEEILADVMNTGLPFHGDELPATLDRNGKVFLAYFNIQYEPLRNEKQEVIGIIQTAIEVTELVEARKKAERSEEMLNLALQGSRIGTWHYDYAQEKFIRNLEHDKIFGYTELQARWNNEIFLKHIHPDDQKIALSSYKAALKSGFVNYEVRIYKTDGNLRWISLKGKTAYNLKGQPISMSGILMDVTEQKQGYIRERQLAVERAAREEVERQRLTLNELFMKLPALICTFEGPQYVFTLVNPMYQQLFPNRKLVGKPMLEALPELKGQQIVEIVDKVYQTGETFVGTEVPIQLERRKGKLESAYFNIVYQAIRDAAGKVHSILVFAVEVTEQLLARQEIENNTASLHLALDAGKMGTWHLDLTRNISKRSPQHDHIFGYKKPLPNWGYESLINHVLPEDRESVESQFNMARKFGDLHFETRILGADQKKRWIFIKGKTFYENEQAVRMAGVVMDITERKMVEEKLKELTEDLASSNNELLKANDEIQTHLKELSQTNQQLKLINADLDNFIYTASHDLKTPISNIEGLMKLLLKGITHEALQKEEVQKPVKLIEASIERFKKTIIELTDIAKIQKESDEVSQVSISEVVHETELDLQTLIQESGAELEHSYDDCDKVSFSHKNLKSIVYNLLSNAIKYRHPQRTTKIKIHCFFLEGQPVLEVSDNGLGIEEKNLKKIFSMYTRLHTHVEGSGVGLYLVKRIVDNAGGRLEVESNPGEGSCFRVVFPQQ